MLVILTAVLGFSVICAPSLNLICAKLSRSVLTVSPFSTCDFCERILTEPSAFLTDRVPESCVTVPLEATAPVETQTKTEASAAIRLLSIDLMTPPGNAHYDTEMIVAAARQLQELLHAQ